MLVKDVLVKYEKLVPFPWTIRKISIAGFIPDQLFLELGEELSQCEDIATPTGNKVLAAIKELKQQKESEGSLYTPPTTV